MHPPKQTKLHAPCYRVLVMDDNPTMANLLKEMLESIGCKAISITDANAFKEKYESFRPDIVFLDIVMPDIDGIELSEWISSSDHISNIVFISGHSPEYSSAAMTLAQAKMNARVQTLRKPVKITEIERALESIHI